MQHGQTSHGIRVQDAARASHRFGRSQRRPGPGRSDHQQKAARRGHPLRHRRHPHYDIGAVSIAYGDGSAPRLGSREVKALWAEYGRRWLEE
jgi:hypothetical protein